MKKIYLLLAMLCMAFTSSIPAAAEDKALFERDGIHYTLGGKNQVYVINSFHYFNYQHYLIDETNYSWLSGDVYIPKSVKVPFNAYAIFGYQDVIGIEEHAFKNMTASVNIWLPSTIKKIDPWSFEYATGLKSIYLNEGLTSLGSDAFIGCTNLTSVNIPSTLTWINDGTFCYCKSLPNMILPTSIKSIGSAAFKGCTSLQIVTGKTSDFIWVDSIGESAFHGCTNLSYISFSGNLQKIGSYAFHGCKNLTDIKLPANLRKIGYYAFAGTGLKTVTNYSPTPQEITQTVFEGVKLPLCMLYVPKGCKDAYKNAPVWKEFGQILEVGEQPAITGVHRIGNLYYDLHEDMTATLVKHEINGNHTGELTIPSTVSFEQYGFTYKYTVTAMEKQAFKGNTGLTKVVLPYSMTEIPNLAFENCSALTDVTLPIPPTSLEKIGNYAFSGTAIKSITIPSTVTSLGDGVFENCTALTSITLPASITTIPQACFKDCTGLTEVYIPSSVTTIGASAFWNCTGLSTITIPEDVTSIGSAAFYYCTGLTSIKCLNETPVDLSGSQQVFDRVPKSTCILYVPVGSKDAYSKADQWKDFINIREQGANERIKVDGLYYQLKEDFTAEVVAEREVDNYSNIGTEVTVKDKVVYQGAEYKVNAVGAYAFSNAVKITKINLPKMMDEIGVYAFQNANLQEINIPATLKRLSNTAFEGTPIFANNMDEQHSVYYDGCLLYHEPNYTSGTFKVKEGTRLIASYALCGANADYSITELELPEGLQCICEGALDYLQALKTVSIPNTVYSIQDYFLTKYCNELQNIYCYSKTPIDISGLTHAFSYWTKDELAQINLYVPYGSKAAYQTADKWKDLNIMEMKPVYTVTFNDYDGTELKVEEVTEGEAAHAPEDPTREGYDFTGWDKDFTNVQSDLTITAQYKRHIYTVLFVDGFTDGVIDTQYVEYGGRAKEPEVPTHEGYAFIGWDKWFGFIRENIIVTAQYAELEGGGLVTTAFDPATGTLTYYFDPEFVQRPGIVEVYHPEAVRFSDYRDLVLKAVIDPSMKDAQITSMKNLFYGNFDTGTFDINSLRKMTSIEGLENLNTSTVTDMNGMFAMCESLTELDLTSFDTKNVTNMNGMIGFCTKLKMVDVSSFDISKVTDMAGMFMGCSSLTTICCSNDWSFTSAKTLNMFFSCDALVGENGTTYDSKVADATYARPDRGIQRPGYFTAETMTGISEELRVKNEELEGEAIYNLAGQRLNKMQKGVNIVNGKKVLVK